jgi:CarD family transcriptional regulator
MSKMPKYAAGDYVVHPGQGICAVADVVEREGADGETVTEYELRPVIQNRLHIWFPVANEDQLRLPIGREEALELIRELPEMEDDPFDSEAVWRLEEHFSNGLRRGSCREALRCALTIRHRVERVHTSGRGPRLCYERLNRTAGRRVLAELGVALGVSDEEVVALATATWRRARAEAEGCCVAVVA